MIHRHLADRTTALAEHMEAFEASHERHLKLSEKQLKQLNNLRTRGDAVIARSECMKVSMTSDDVYFEGCNVHVLSGSDDSFVKNSYGNVILGYDERDVDGECPNGCAKDGR